MAHGDLPFTFDDTDPTKPQMWIRFDEYELVNLVEMMKVLKHLDRLVHLNNGYWFRDFVDKLESALSGVRHGVDEDHHMNPNVFDHDLIAKFREDYDEEVEGKMRELLKAASALLTTAGGK